MNTKRCSKCKETKPVDAFYKRHGRPKGQCKACEREYMKKYRPKYYKEHKKEILQKTHEYFEQNKERIYEQQHEYRQRNKEKTRARSRRLYQKKRKELIAYQKEYYEQHRDEKLAYADVYREDNQERIAAYRENHKDRANELQRQHYAENPEYYKQTVRRRRVRKQELSGDFTIEQWLTLVDFFEGVCPCCEAEAKSFSVDHIIPISWEESTNWITNIQPLCGSCNSWKGAAHCDDYRPEYVRQWAERIR